MEFKIIRHTYENTGGGTMIGFDEVWLPDEDRTIFVRTNEMGSSFWTVDAYYGELDDVEPFDLICPENMNDLNHKYFELARECMRQFLLDDGYNALPYEWLPTRVQEQITDHYKEWMIHWTDDVNPFYSSNGRDLKVHELYNPPVEPAPSLDSKEYHRLVAAMYGIKDAFVELNEVWNGTAREIMNDDIIEDYPFHKSFDELSIDVQEWVWTVLHEAEKYKPEVQ